MYRITSGMEKISNIGQRNKMDKGNLDAKVKSIEDEISNKEAFINRKEIEMEGQKRNEHYHASYING